MQDKMFEGPTRGAEFVAFVALLPTQDPPQEPVSIETGINGSGPYIRLCYDNRKEQ